MALAVDVAVALVCGTLLLALRWWLEAKRPGAAEDLRTRIEALESWKSRNEAGKLR